jgi:hypothetical protein
MQKAFFFLFFICFGYCHLLFAQTNLIPYHNGNLWGYCNAAKQIVVSPVYYFADAYHKNRAWVCDKAKKWAMIDEKNRKLTPFVYDDYSLINDSIYLVSIYFTEGEGKQKIKGCNLVTKEGRELFAWRYGSIKDIGNGFFDAERHYFESENEKKDLEKKQILLDLKGNERSIPLIKGQKIMTKQEDHTADLLQKFRSVKMGYFWGLQNKKGEVVVPCKYEEEIRPFLENRAVVRLQGVYGLIDQEGNEIVSPKYDQIGDFSEGMAAVEFNGKFGFIDTTGKLVLPIQYEQARNADNQAVYFKEMPIFNALPMFEQGITYIEGYGWIDKKGKAFFDNPTQKPLVAEDLQQFTRIWLASGINLETHRRKLMVEFSEKPTISFVDLDKDQKNELIVGIYTGGAHCCNAETVFYLNDKKQYTPIIQNADIRLAKPNSEGKIDLIISFLEQFAYFHTCYACGVEADAPDTYLYRYEQGKLVLPKVNEELNTRIENNLQTLSKLPISPLSAEAYETDDVRLIPYMKLLNGKNNMDEGERKTYLFNCIAYYMNNQRNLEKTQAIFDKYYHFQPDKALIWAEIANILKKI